MRSTQAAAAGFMGLALVLVIAIVAIGGGDDDGAVDADELTKPTVQVPSGAPPDGLGIEDLTVGEGEEAQVGDSVSVHYVGVTFDEGEEFDASWDRGEPFTIQLGAGQVIQGWDDGLVGMREGGRRQLVIPPELAYGEAGAPPAIGPDETLVFVVDLLSIN